VAKKAQDLLCTNCGCQGKPKLRVKGSFFIEIILWLFFIVPGLIYTIWRLTTKQNVCVKCGSENLIPLDSPKAQQVLAELKGEST